MPCRNAKNSLRSLNYTCNTLHFISHVPVAGTSKSPCCSQFEMQNHVTGYWDHVNENKGIMWDLEESFYLDNLLQNRQTAAESLADELVDLKSAGGFDTRQRASDDRTGQSLFPTDATSKRGELLLLEMHSGPQQNLCWAQTLFYLRKACPSVIFYLPFCSNASFVFV